MTRPNPLLKVDVVFKALEAQRASMIERGSRMWSRWGKTPLVKTTGMWLAELDRRIGELAGLTKAIERGRRV